MDNTYRKIGIGDNVKEAMYYVVGSYFKGFLVSDIIKKDNEFVIYLSKDDEKQEWRSFSESIVTIKEKMIIE